jgi:hypothetical protein
LPLAASEKQRRARTRFSLQHPHTGYYTLTKRGGNDEGNATSHASSGQVVIAWATRTCVGAVLSPSTTAAAAL